MKTIPHLKEAVIKLDENRGKMEDMGTIRVDVRNVEQLKHEARTSGFTLFVDEPEERGGTNAATNPLSYFVLGAASCFLTQIARSTIINGYEIDSMEVTARGHFRRTTREFTEVIYDIRLTGSESNDRTIELLHDAESRCFVHQTLKKSLPLISNLSMNGTLLVTSTVGPDGAKSE
jgi:uncharacterized OsmC-like protein